MTEVYREFATNDEAQAWGREHYGKWADEYKRVSVYDCPCAASSQSHSSMAEIV